MKASPSPLQIILPSSLSNTAFERILSRHYVRSREERHVCFDLSALEWIGPFEAALLAIWIRELQTTEVVVHLHLPPQSPVRSFLNQLRFEEVVNATRIDTAPTLAGRTPSPEPLFNQRAFLPLTPLNAPTFTDTMSALRRKDALDALMRGAETSHIVRSGAIRDVVIAELGDNVFTHADGRLGYMLLVMLTSSPPRADRSLRAPTQSPSREEGRYLDRLAGGRYVALVIADKGPGIAATLRAAYQRHNPTGLSPDSNEADILRYAFRYESTRRTTAERIGALAALLRSTDDFPPPTGLYRLADTVRRFGGFMFVRSGATILTYDSLESPASEIKSFQALGNLKQLSEFGGTQFKLYFPVEPPRPVQTTYTRSFGAAKGPKDREYAVVLADQSAQVAPNATHEAEATAVLGFLEMCDRERATRNRADGFVITGLEDSNLSSKALHYLLLELSRRQTETWANILIVTNDELLERAGALAARRQVDSKPLLFLAPGQDPWVVIPGHASRERYDDPAGSLIEALQQHSIGHLYQRSERNGAYEARHSPHAISDALRAGLEEAFAGKVLSPPSAVFQPSALVLLRSRRYCHGYFAVYHVLEDPQLKRLVTYWLYLRLLEKDVDTVVAVGDVAWRLVQEAVTYFPHQVARPPVRTFRTETDPQPLEIVKLGFEISKHARVAVVTDVVGTGHQLNTLLRYLRYTQLAAVLSIVDARPNDDSAVLPSETALLPVAALRRPLSYHTDLPEGWEYKDVCQIDPTTNRLIIPDKGDGPLWEAKPSNRTWPEASGSDTFISEVIEPVDGCAIGHFSLRASHATVLFDIPQVARMFASTLAERIQEDLKKRREPLPAPVTIGAIAYPADNPGLEPIVSALAVHLPEARLIPIPAELLRAGAPAIFTQFAETVLLFDDAMASGRTFLRLFDLAEAGGARRIFAYALIRRGSAAAIRETLKITRFGKASVQSRYLADLLIPTFDRHQCPVCAHRLSLETLRDEYRATDEVRYALDSEIRRLEPISVHSLQGGWRTAMIPLPNVDAGNLRLRWTLEQAKLDPGARRALAQTVLDALGNDRSVEAQLSALALLRLLALERHDFLYNSEVATELFYPRLQDVLLQFSEKVVVSGNAEELALEGALVVLLNWAPDRVRSRLGEILFQNKAPAQAWPRLLATLLAHDTVRPSPRLFLRALRHLRSEVETAPSTLEAKALTTALHHMIEYSETQISKTATSQDMRAARFRTLTGQSFHECSHYLSLLRFCLEPRSFALPRVASSWRDLRLDLERADHAWHEFSMGSDSLATEKVTDLFLQLRLVLEETSKQIAALSDNQQRYGRSAPSSALSNASTLAGITKALDRIHHMVYGSDGILDGLRQFQSNIKQELFPVRRQLAKEFADNGMHVTVTLPDDAAVVIGESGRIGVILFNLLENCIHAEATAVHIVVLPDMEGQTIDLDVYDNGVGVGDSVRYGAGLRKVDLYARESSAHFDLGALPVADPLYSVGYRTRARVRFHSAIATA